jgi:type I restriction enzyme S subunit
MSDKKRKLPEGWRWEELGNLFTIDKQQIDPSDPSFYTLPFIGMENIESNTRKFIPNGNTEEGGDSTCLLFDDTHVLYGKLRPYLNKVYLPDKKGRCSTELLPLMPKNGYSRSFIASVLQSQIVVNYAVKHSTGGRMPRADMEKLKKLKAPIPSNPNDQLAIAADLERRMAQVERMRGAARRQKEAVAAMKNAILREFFVSMKNDQWHLTKISQIAHIIMGQSPDGSSYNKEGAGIPLLNGPTEFGDEHPTPIQWTTSPKKLCHVGDLIVCVRGNTTGKMNWANQDYCLGRGVAGIRGKEEKGNTIFIKYALEYKINELLVGSERSTFPNLEKEELNSFEIFAPKDLFMQEKVAKTIKEKLETLNQLASSISSQVSAIEALPGAILREVFDFEGENIGD